MAKGWAQIARGSIRRRAKLSAGMKEGEEIETERETAVRSERVVMLVSSMKRGRAEEVRAQKGLAEG